MPAYLKKLMDEVDEPETTIEELVEISLDENDPEKKVLASTMLKKEEKEELANLLHKNKDVFAWSHKDIPGIDPSKTKHYLNINPKFSPIRQK